MGKARDCWLAARAQLFQSSKPRWWTKRTTTLIYALMPYGYCPVLTGDIDGLLQTSDRPGDVMFADGIENDKVAVLRISQQQIAPLWL
jgi:hypothetical protein